MKTSEEIIEFCKERIVEDTSSYETVAANEAYEKVIEFVSQLKTVEEPLRNLLAILHRDGGHYVAKHGLEKAINDAIELIHKEWVLPEFKTVEPEKKMLPAEGADLTVCDGIRD